MPQAAPKPCIQCSTLVYDGSSRCMAHKAKVGSFADSRRGSRHERGYGSDWDKRRARILKRDAGLCQCEDCTLAGLVKIATHVDHRVNKAEWKRLHGSLAGVDDDSNLRAINADCHKRKTQSEALAARLGQGGGGQKSGASLIGTDRLVEFLRAGNPGGGVPLLAAKEGA